MRGYDAGFQVVLPARSAREAQIVTALAEICLRYSPDRAHGQEDDLGDQDAYLPAHALGWLLTALTEHVLPAFQEHFYGFWNDTYATEWQMVANHFEAAAQHIRQCLADIERREGDVSIETPSTGGDACP